MTARFFHTHAHSVDSVLDGMGSVGDMVDKAVELGHPGLAITDHGLMGSGLELVQRAKAAGIKPFPGSELYVVPDVAAHIAAKGQGHPRRHMVVGALTFDGYRALVGLSSRSNSKARRYRGFPLVDYTDLAELAESGATADLYATSGCFFGVVPQALMTEGRDAAVAVARTLATWFPHFYVEVQHHNTPRTDGWDDSSLTLELAGIAAELGLPLLITQDCHYVEATHQIAHDRMKQLGYGNLGDDDLFPGDGYHMCDWSWIAGHFDQLGAPGFKILNEVDASYGDLLDRWDLHIPSLDGKKFLMPPVAVTGDPDFELAELVRVRFERLCADGTISDPDLYQTRIDTELATVSAAGFGEYFLMQAQLADWMASQAITWVVRGSANGCLVLWLLGMVTEDPIVWGLSMDGFLTANRDHPPDVDIDIQTSRRNEVVDYVLRRWPGRQMSTPSRLGWDADTGNGSITRKYVEARRRELASQGQTEVWARRYGSLLRKDDPDNLVRLRKADPQAWPSLELLAEIRPYSTHGTHAAAVVLDPQIPGLSLDDLVPLRYASSSDLVVTQCTMDPIEAAGLVKLDCLGSQTLDQISVTLDDLGWTTDDYRAIPLDDPVVYGSISAGEPGNGVFQLEGWSMAKGLAEMAPRTIHELIQSLALFRPGVSKEFRAQFLAGRAAPARVQFRNDLCAEVLAETHGVFVFTEQVQQVLGGVGLDPVVQQRLLKAMKVKHGKAGMSAASTAAFVDARTEFLEAASANDLDDAAETWEDLVGFQRYAFKRSHATAYGLISYRTAWLRHHHPTAFYHGVLSVIWANTADKDRRRRAEEAARSRGVRLLRCEVNRSAQNWSIEGNHLRRGYADVAGITGSTTGAAIAAAQPFESLDDMRSVTIGDRRLTGWKTWDTAGEFSGQMRALQDAGALAGLGLRPGETRTWDEFTVTVRCPPSIPISIQH